MVRPADDDEHLAVGQQDQDVVALNIQRLEIGSGRQDDGAVHAGRDLHHVGATVDRRQREMFRDMARGAGARRLCCSRSARDVGGVIRGRRRDSRAVDRQLGACFRPALRAVHDQQSALTKSYRSRIRLHPGRAKPLRTMGAARVVPSGTNPNMLIFTTPHYQI